MNKLKLELGGTYRILEKLGQGSFASVHHCLRLDNSEQVAVKVINKIRLSDKQISSAVEEAVLLSSLHHPNIVKFKRVVHTDSFILIEMELLKGGTLTHKMKSGKLSEEQAALIMKCVFSAVKYLHKENVLHRDLKPDNIMFANSNDLGSLKLTDFGLSTRYCLEEQFNNLVGTVIYMAPEQLQEKHYSEPVDIWSCGIIMFTLLAGKHPLYSPGDSKFDFVYKLKKLNWKFPKNFPSLAKDLFLHCTKALTLERYTASIALRHPWITRKGNKIPLTHLEATRIHQGYLKLKTMFAAAMILGKLRTNTSKISSKYLSIIRQETQTEPSFNEKISEIPLRKSAELIKYRCVSRPMKSFRITKPIFNTNALRVRRSKFPSVSPSKSRSRLVKQSKSPVLRRIK